MLFLSRFMRLIRWPNLVFIALTQALFHYCIVYNASLSGRSSLPLLLNPSLFWLLCLASMLIAGAGYIINDYFDINIDRINKPERLILDNGISRRQGLIWHLLLSISGLALSAWVSFATSNPLILAGNIACVLLLWVYSTTYKRKPLIGNLLIALLTGWVVLVLIVAELPMWWQGSIDSATERAYGARLIRLGLLYSVFAFITTLIREVIKDLEDMEGDRREGCRTMPLQWGINLSRVFALIWIIVVAGLLVVTSVYVLQFGWWWLAAYLIIAVLIPLVLMTARLMKASQPAHFAKLSSGIKWVMLAGIFSMLFFIFYR